MDIVDWESNFASSSPELSIQFLLMQKLQRGAYIVEIILKIFFLSV
jgi:hypothetical protein